MGNIKKDIEAINEYVEFERMMTGQDDELEDDEWMFGHDLNSHVWDTYFFNTITHFNYLINGWYLLF